MFFKSIITAFFSNYAAPFQPIGIVGYAMCAPLFGMNTNIEKKYKKVNNFTKIYIESLIEKKPEKTSGFGNIFYIGYSQPLHTSIHAQYPEYFSSSGIVSSIALLALPQAGNTVWNR